MAGGDLQQEVGLELEVLMRSQPVSVCGPASQAPGAVCAQAAPQRWSCAGSRKEQLSPVSTGWGEKGGEACSWPQAGAWVLFGAQ